MIYGWVAWMLCCQVPRSLAAAPIGYIYAVTTAVTTWPVWLAAERRVYLSIVMVIICLAVTARVTVSN